MILYNYNPDLPKPFCWVHPLKVNEVMSIAQSKFPAEIRSFLLFGGALDPSCDGYSDIDLYAVVDNEYLGTDEENRENRFDSLNRTLRNVIKQSTKKYDLLIATADDFEAEANRMGSVESEICKQGVRIYAK